MTNKVSIRVTPLSAHVVQLAVPAPTLPPALETNTYVIVSRQEALVVDAGSDNHKLLEEITANLQAMGVERTVALIATHHHPDHTQGLPLLQRSLEAPLYIHPADMAAAHRLTQRWSPKWQPLPDVLHVGDLVVHVTHAPGHTHGHVHVWIPQDQVILVGDHLAGDGSVWIGPPDGHMADYFRALDHIAASGARIAGPGHGNALPDAAQAAQTLKQRRQMRELQILEEIQYAPLTADNILQRIYGETLHPGAVYVARRTILAHLAHLVEQGRIRRIFDTAQGRFVYTRASL